MIVCMGRLAFGTLGVGRCRNKLRFKRMLVSADFNLFESLFQ